MLSFRASIIAQHICLFVAYVCTMFMSYSIVAQTQEAAFTQKLEATIDSGFDGSIDATQQFQYLITSENALLSDILQKHQWQEHRQIVDIPSDSAIWLRVNVNNSSNINRELTLTIGNSYIVSAEAHLLDEQLRIIQSSRLQGDEFDDTSFGTRGVKLNFSVRSASTLSIYIQIQNEGLSVLPIALWQADAYAARLNQRAIQLGAMSGALALLAAYFLLTYVLRATPARFWFCIFTTAAMTTMLSVEGILPNLFLLSAFAPEITSISLVITLFATIKISRSVFQPMHRWWVYAHYFLLVCSLVGVFFLDDYIQLLAVILFSSLFSLSKIIASIVYRNTIDFRSATIYFVGWITLCLVGGIEVFAILNNNSYLSFATAVPIILVCIGVMLIGVAIISREQSVQLADEKQQLENVKALEQYQALFNYSAEGLYTADASGKLINVNPAMCALFGYEDVQSFIQEYDYLSKLFSDPREPELLLGELSIQQTVIGREVKGRRRDGREFWFSISAKLQKMGDRVNENVMHYGAILDITEHRINKINLQYLNSHDQLTGLYNRRYFCELINDTLKKPDNTDTHFSLLVLDVDNFKVINDSCGHLAGDIFIKELSYQLFEVLDHHLPFARLNADRFAVLIDKPELGALQTLAENLITQVENFDFNWEQHAFKQSASIGIVSYPDSIDSTNAPDNAHVDAEQLMVHADTAIVFAKQADSTANIQYYSNKLNQHSRHEQDVYWVNEVNKALENDSFELFYQHYRPIASSDEHEYYELLLRLRTDKDELVAPEFFMPSSERANIGQSIDKRVIERFFAWLSDDNNRLSKLAKANINLSSMSIIDEDFRFFLVNAFDKYKIPYEKICFEIKETIAVINIQECIDFITTFKKYGCTFALDSFGGGFSNYSFLKSLPIDELKINGHFIRNILSDKTDLAMVSAIVDVAKSMNIKTSAEFVESKDIMVQVGKLGVDYAQGYSIAKPRPLTQYKPYTQAPE